jgi:hypothetical protein
MTRARLTTLEGVGRFQRVLRVAVEQMLTLRRPAEADEVFYEALRAVAVGSRRHRARD